MGVIFGRKKEVDKSSSLTGVNSFVKEQDSPTKATEMASPPENVAETTPKNDVSGREDDTKTKEKTIAANSVQEMKPTESNDPQLPPSPTPPSNDGTIDSNNIAADAGNKEATLGAGDKTKDLQIISDRCCQEIERQCAEHVNKKYLSSGTNTSGWRVIRLFVSSTFQDFHNEREVLVKKVFPELHEWCESRHLHLIECDLRWGVPKDSTTRTVLTTCMEEIDRCHGDANGEGFFLNMLGDRYGWVPSTDDIPNDIAEEYKWVPFTSVTHMEILLGAYRSRNPNAAFFLRDSSGFVYMIPDENRHAFVEPTELGKLLLKELRAKLLERFPEQTFSYSCEFGATQDSKIILKGLDDFGKQVLEFFKKAIENKFAEHENIAASPEKLEQDRHDIYMEQKGGLVFGRDSEIGKMMNFANGIYEDGDVEADRQRHHMVVTADPGEGKSSLMARFVMEAKKAGLTVFYHFVGCTAESNRPSSILKRLVERLEELYPDTCRSISENEDDSAKNTKTADEQNVEKMATYIKNLGETDNRLLIVVDAVNQTSQEDDRYRWVPATLSGNLHCVMSTTREDHTPEELNKLCPDAAELTLTTLSDKAREEIVTNYFGRYSKTLDPEQLVLLTHSEGAQNALWLSLSCEELRIFGVFEKLTDRIREMPISLEGLIENILARLVKEDETGMVEKMLHYLQCVTSGLNETELQAILGDIDGGTPAPALHWAMVRRSLKPYLRNSAARGEVERLQFFHLAINKAVQKQLTEDYDLKKLRHRQLADYYQYHCNDSVAVTNQLARQLAQAKEGQRLVSFFRTDIRSTGVNKIDKSRILKEIRCTKRIHSSFPGCTNFAFCAFCMNARSKLVPNPIWHNKDCCAICGNNMPFPGSRNAKAYWCPLHKLAFSSGAKFSCYTCQKPIPNPRGDPPLAYICRFCDPGFMEQCCKLAP